MEESQGSRQQNLMLSLLMMLKVFSNSSPETDGINIGIRADDEEIDPN